MKNNEENRKQATHIDSILEVRICAEMWGRIKWVAAERDSSYSWVVRYALFRLLKRADPKRGISHIGNPRLLSGREGGLNERAWARRRGASRVGAGGKHRHRLCLYGEDELAIRYTAAYYGCTMTHLIRVALELYFERLYATMLRAAPGPAAGSLAQAAFWFWLGIKVFKGVEFHCKPLEKKTILFQRYRRSEYHPARRTPTGRLRRRQPAR